MKIAIIGAGALGLLYGGYLSKENDVNLICHSQSQAEEIEEYGVVIEELDGSCTTYYPNAVADSQGIGVVDVVILLVKATASLDALSAHRMLIGENTLLLTLQNGAGHEEIMAQFASQNQLALGVTYEGSFRENPHTVRRTGVGTAFVDMLAGERTQLENLVASCRSCGLQAKISANIRHRIWSKLMVNASSSVLCAVLGMEQGYCYTNPTAWAVVGDLVGEMIAVAKADGMVFNYEDEMANIQRILTTSPKGIPSICVDLRAGKKTEVDTISGSVIKAGIRTGVPTPNHEFIVKMVHMMEGRNNL